MNDLLKDMINERLGVRQEMRESAMQKRKQELKLKKYRLTGLARARAWALVHFNANAKSNSPLDKPSFIVAFDGDKMTVDPSLYGKGFGLPTTYTYSGTVIGDCWAFAKNPMTDSSLPILVVIGDFYE